ncbi:MAG: hypothetical protein MR980_08095 [Bacteroidales bacterium]|nr:hypothetical protein [Bacteroidales bacterium]
MAPIQIKQFLFVGALCAGSAFLTTACVDNSYDLSEDLDLTMGLGSNGLSVPMGNVEKIYLNDILSVDESVKLDAANQYYLVEDGTTNFDFTIDKVTTKVDNPTLRTDPGKPALPFNKVCEILGEAGISSITLPAVPQVFSGEAEGTESMDFSVTDISSDIKAIHSVSFTPLKVSLSLEWFKSNAALKFDLKELKDVEITLPSILHVVEGSVSEGWTLTEGNKLVAHSVAFNGANMKEIVSFMIDQTQLKDCSTIENGELSISPEVLHIKMKGGADFVSTGSFTMTSNDYMDVRLYIKVGTPGANNKTNVYVTRAKGVFDPLINPDVESIDIASELPDFLKDPEVRVNVSNPTLKFNVYPKNNVQIPADVDFYATLHSIKDGQDQVSPVEFPKYTRLYKNTSNVIYFHQDVAPYDPTGLETDAPGKKVQTKKVDNISSLISVLPDRIEVDLGANGNDKHICVVGENEVALGQKYSQVVDYTIYVPFEFKNGVTIVYTDETDGMNEDLKDYAADGIQISAEAENTIPLDLKATISAYDMYDNLISGIQFEEVDVKAGGGTDATAVTTALTIKATLTDPNLLKKLDKLEFKINAASEATSNATHKLVSTQYVQLKNVKLKLVGQIVADFNDN